MPIELSPQYDPKSVEQAIYQRWLEAGAFHAVPDERPPEKRFSVVIPPPNVTGALHLGHAINGTIQDILARYHRMKGDNTLWMPGIDHAGIATQAVVEKTIFEKEKKNRHDLGREELVRRIWEWKEQFGTRILAQLQSIGASCDWERTRFTLDEVCARAVREAFFKMFKDGLIFRGKRLVNWDTHLQTAVADDEIYHETVRGEMVSIRYPVAREDKETGRQGDNETEYLVVATTRAETMLGDTAVAVHPEDARYKHLIGGHVIVPLVGRRIPIIADGLLVDPAFGTGVVKVTPAHDPNDYATGVRHGLEQINLLTADGKVNENGAGEFSGKKYSYVGLKFATAARKAVLADLEALGLIVEKKAHEHEVGHSDRSKTPIEPFLSDQWFVRMGDIEGKPSETRPLGSVASQSEETPPPQTLPYGRVSDSRVSEDKSNVTPHSNAMAYFITFHTYASWLHGQEQGSVDPEHNTPDTPFIPPDMELLKRDARNLEHPPVELTLEQRQSVVRTIQEVAEHRGWTLRAVNVRTTHVHVVVSGDHAPERMMNDFKSYATRRMVEAGLLGKDSKPWSRHGSTRYLWKPDHVSGAVRYTLYEQGENAPGTSAGKTLSETRPTGSVASEMEASPPLCKTLPYGRVSEARDSETRPSESVVSQGNTTQTLPYGRVSDSRVSDGRVSDSRVSDGRVSDGRVSDGRGSDGRGSDVSGGVTLADGTRASGLAQAAMDAVTSGRVRIVPERYAKGYLDWLGQKRDWCISRQLWWGHRIPVWSISPQTIIGVWNKNSGTGRQLEAYQEFGARLVAGAELLIQEYPNSLAIINQDDSTQDAKTIFAQLRSGKWTGIHIAVRENEHPAIPMLEELGWQRDPDVLDTWFSSALWPISTMGWPAQGTSEKAEDQLLPYFYPTSLLSTAREILTLWVARMVMFGLYCAGDVPFKDVYIHAIIQDGEGRPMKKTLGNGVDPVDIVASHGADALRFTLAAMATETQDIRMPVVKDAKTGRNTSPKFDLGRNFANKIWNASRFILSNFSGQWSVASGQKYEETAIGQPTALEDRWILSRLNQTIRAAEAGINGYRFAEMAESLRSFFWTDLCDWYLEIAKGRIKAGDATVRAVLLHCLRTALKVLHPVMPFITEELWGKLSVASGQAEGMLITAPWPEFEAGRVDAAAEKQIALIQSVTSGIREIQNRYPGAKGKAVILRPYGAEEQQILERSRAIIEALSGAPVAENSCGVPTPKDAATVVLDSAHIFIPGVIDKAAEAAKLMKRKGELEKFIAGGRAKVGNAAAVAKAPAQVVQGWREQLAKQEEELAAVVRNLEELSC